MEQPISHSPGGSMPWLIRRQGRITAAIVAIAIAYMATRGLPDELNLLIPYNVGVAVYISLFCVLMGRASPEDAAEMTRRGEPNNRLVLITVIALSVVSLVGVAAMLNHPPGQPRWEINLHMAASLRGDPFLIPGPYLFWSSLHATLLRRPYRRRQTD